MFTCTLIFHCYCVEEQSSTDTEKLSSDIWVMPLIIKTWTVDLLFLWFYIYKGILVVWMQKQSDLGICFYRSPRRMFSQVITLCGWAHNQHSVIYPSDRERVSWMCLWCNWAERDIDSVSWLLHNPGENVTRELRGRNDRQRTSSSVL